MLLEIKHKIVELVRLLFSEMIHTELAIENFRAKAAVCEKRGVTDLPLLDEPLVVSLTTFGQRVFDVHLVVESIMQQTVLPNRIILWLDETEFNESSLPLSLKKMQQRGLEIRYCPNLRSYKKIIPTLKLVPEATVITIDDDVLYPEDFVERLVSAYKADKKCIYFCRGRYILRNKKGYAPYKQWKMVDKTEKRMDILPTGIGGVLYPRGCFFKDVLDENLFMRLCPKADDVWLRVMTLKQGYPCCLVEYSGQFRYSFVNLDRTQQRSALSNNNLYSNANDVQIEKSFSHYEVSL